MRISEFEATNVGDRQRISAQISWEDTDREDYELYFETCAKYGDALTLDTSAFLVGAIVPALYFGEHRVAVDGPVCAELRSNVEAAVAMLKHWHYPPARPFSIEAQSISSYKSEGDSRLSGLFFSGGVDSYFTLQSNRNLIPEDHPLYMRQAIIAFGLELDDTKSFDHVLETIEPAANSSGLDLLPIYTNVYLPYRSMDKAQHFSMWLDQMNGPALAAIGHACSGRVSNIAISATLQPDDFGRPYGSHPLIDEKLSSGRLRVRHTGIEYTRLQKICAIANNDIALNSLRVCNQFKTYEKNRLNCGRCEKCIRTMLALIALDALKNAGAFFGKDVSSDDIQRLPPLKPFQIAMYEELLGPLGTAGREDLVGTIRDYIARSRRARTSKKITLPKRAFKKLKRVLRA